MSWVRPRNFPLLLLPLTLAGSFVYFMMSAKHEVKPTNPARDALVRSSADQQLQKFKLTGFDENGKSNWKLEGETAKIDPGQTVFLDQNVTLRLKDDTVIRTDHVQWSQDGGTLRTHAWVNVEHETVKVKGRGATGRPNDGYIQLNRDIDMTINASTHLSCEGPLKIFYNENKMYFYRKVKVVDSRGTLSSNRMDVTFDAQTKRIKQILAIGNVTIRRDGDVTRSQRAIYSVDTGSVRLEGNPEITLEKGRGGILDGSFRN